MEPIVSPWLIYFIDFADRLQFICICGILICVYLYIRLGCKLDYLEDRRIDATNTRKNRSLTKLFIIIFILLFTFVPGQETLIKMIIASYLTPDNIAAVGKYAGEAVDMAGNYTENVTVKTLDLITDSAIKIIKEIKN